MNKISAIGSKYNSFLGISCPKDYVIDADTEPDCDQWGPDCFWEAKHWIKLHEEKVKKYGKVQADISWAAAWSKCRGIGGAFGHELWLVNNDPEFIRFVMAQKLYLVSPDLAFIKAQDDTVKTASEVAGNVADILQSTASAANTTVNAADTLIQFLPWVVLAAGLLFAWVVIQKKSFKAAIQS